MTSFPFLPTASAALKRHWLPSMAAFVSALVGSIVYLSVTPPLYESSVRLILEERDETISDLGRTLSQLDNPGAGADPLATQSELIVSEEVLSRAIEKLTLTDDSLSLGVSQLENDVSIQIIPATNILELSYIYTDPDAAAKILDAIVESTAEINGEAIRQRASLIREFLESQLPEQETRLMQAENKESRFRQRSGIVALDDQVQGLVEGLGELSREERELKSQLQEVEERARLIQQVTGVATVNDAYAAVRVGQDSTLEDLRQRLTELDAEIIESSSRLGDQHPEMLALLEQQQNLNALYQQQLGQNASVQKQTVDERLAPNPLSQDLMAQYISNEIEYQALNKRFISIQAEKASLQTRLTELPALSRPLAALNRQREAAEESLQTLRRNLEEARLAEAQLVSNIRLLGKASVAEAPSEPSAPVVLILGIVAGSILATATLIILEVLDDKLHNLEEATSLFELPVLGKIPSFPIQILKPEELSSLTESLELTGPYYALVKALEYGQNKRPDFSKVTGNKPQTTRSAEAIARERLEKTQVVTATPRKSKIIVVSSAFWGEGKTMIVRHLAATTSTLGYKTLIIDADLRHSLQSNFFGLDNAPGLTDVIEAGKPLQSVCHSGPIENLNVLPKGQLLGNPSAVIESPSMQNLLNEASTLYDWIIVDTAPITESSEIISLSQYAEGVAMVVRPNFQSKYKIREVTAEFKRCGGSVLGLVFNEVGMSDKEQYWL